MTLALLRSIPAHATPRTVTSDGRDYKLDRRVTALAFVDDDRLLCGSADHTLSLWDLRTNERVHELTSDGHDVRCVAVSPDKRRALSGHGSWGGVKLWDLERGTHQDLVSAMYIGAVAFAPDGRALAAKGTAAWVWSPTGDLEREPDDDGVKSTTMALSPDGAHAARMTSNGAVLLSFPALRKKHALEGLHADRGVIAFSADGALVAAGNDDGEVRVWRTPDGALERSVSVEDGVASLALDARQLLVGTAGGDVVRVTTASERLTLDRMSVDALALRGRIAAAGTYGGEVRLLEVG